MTVIHTPKADASAGSQPTPKREPTNGHMRLLWQQKNKVSYCNPPTRPDCA
jgi:hypothetical protein